MPAKWFICPDGQRTEITECLQHCRLTADLPGGRCLSARTLRAIAEQRPWTGVPSTTQLLKGVREAYLELTTDYCMDPQGALFRVHGSKAHAFLDQFTGNNALGEERLQDEVCSGQFDYYEDGILWDVKTWGSYKIMKSLGMYQIEVATGEVFKTGPRKGQPKTHKEWREGGRKDRLDVAIQMNDYRMKLEGIGFPVQQMVVEALARDGGTFVARGRGVEQNGVLIQINRISDRWISRYMVAKSKRLLAALESGTLPPKCKSRETWSWRKCDGYCNVSEACKAAQSRVNVGRLEDYLAKEVG